MAERRERAGDGVTDPFGELSEANERLVARFGAHPIGDVEGLPDCPTFRRDLVYSHRDLDGFLRGLAEGDSCAIVSGFNASGPLHLGHKAVLDTELCLQRKYGIPLFLPISDDESYLTGRTPSPEVALENAVGLARQILAYGFDPARTYVMIDQVYTDIYNLAMRLARRLTLSAVRATYGYSMEDNPGLYFYPAVQAAHVLLPLVALGYHRVLVPIGPDEDSHLRLARDLADRFGLPKPAVLHTRFQPGLDGAKMSKTGGNTIGLFEDELAVRQKVARAYSGGATSVAEHRRYGGDPSKDVALHYLEKFFFSPEEARRWRDGYRDGAILSGEVKRELADRLVVEVRRLRAALQQVTDRDLAGLLVTNERLPYPSRPVPSFPAGRGRRVPGWSDAARRRASTPPRAGSRPLPGGLSGSLPCGPAPPASRGGRDPPAGGNPEAQGRPPKASNRFGTND